MNQEGRDKAILEREGVMRYTATILNPNIHYPTKITWAVQMDHHYALMEISLSRKGEGNSNIFEIACNAIPQEVTRRLYQRAREFLGNCDIDDKTGYSLRDTVV